MAPKSPAMGEEPRSSSALGIENEIAAFASSKVTTGMEIKAWGSHAAAPIPSRVCASGKTLSDLQTRTLGKWGVLAAGVGKHSLFPTA